MSSSTIATIDGLSLDSSARVYRDAPGRPRPEYLGRIDRGVYAGRTLSDREWDAWHRLVEAFHRWRKSTWGGVESIEQILADTA